jgi:putative redox protein
MTSRKLMFTNPQGVSLVARLDLPDSGEPLAWTLFAHCFTCSKDLNAVVNISRSLNREKIAVLRFDFTGLGESQGDFSETTFLSNVSDLIAAAQMLEERHQAPAILIGHSLGGAAVLQAAARIPSVRAVAAIAAPSDPRHVVHLFEDKQRQIEIEGAAEVNLAGRPFTIRKSFLDALDSTQMARTIGDLGKALLVLHSPLDEVVGIDHAARIFQAAKHPKSFVSLDSADHLLTHARDSQYAGTIIAAWAKRYLSAADPM